MTTFRKELKGKNKVSKLIYVSILIYIQNWFIFINLYFCERVKRGRTYRKIVNLTFQKPKRRSIYFNDEAIIYTIVASFSDAMILSPKVLLHISAQRNVQWTPIYTPPWLHWEYKYRSSLKVQQQNTGRKSVNEGKGKNPHVSCVPQWSKCSLGWWWW
jgi:hypothetical protein